MFKCRHGVLDTEECLQCLINELTVLEKEAAAALKRQNFREEVRNGLHPDWRLGPGDTLEYIAEMLPEHEFTPDSKDIDESE